MNWDKYNVPKESFPDYPATPVHPNNKAGSLVYKEYALALERYEDALKIFEKKRNEYNLVEATLIEQFWQDAFKELNIPREHPKANLLRSKAWDHGHASGLEEVYCWLGEFWELVK